MSNKNIQKKYIFNKNKSIQHKEIFINEKMKMNHLVQRIANGESGVVLDELF